MVRNFLRLSNAGKALILGALLILAVPGIAFATLTVTVETPGPTGGPFATFSEISPHADCESGMVSGGGIDQAIGTGMSSNGNHVNGTVPSDDGTTEYTGTAGSVGNNDTHWIAIGGSGGQYNNDFATTPFAMCFTSTVVSGTEIIMNKTAGPVNAGAIAVAVATCPAGKKLLGGGGRTIPASVGSLKVAGTFPSFSGDTAGVAAGDGETNPNSWTTVGLNGGGGDSNNTTYTYAICGSGNNLNGVTVTVQFDDDAGPTSSAAVQKETVGCGDSGTLLSGGASISGGDPTASAFTAPGSSGDHLNGSFPSDSGGNSAGDGTSPSYWTASTHTGGGGSTSATRSGVWAVCATGM